MRIVKAQATCEPSFVEVDFFHPPAIEAFSGFGLLGRHHAMGIRMLSPAGRHNVMYVMESDGPKAIEIIRAGRAIGFVPAGVPHHLTQDFGWWHVNSTEEIYIPIVLTDRRIAFVILEAQTPERVDKFQWYCHQCHNFLFEREVQTGKVAIEGYWEAEQAAIVEFNQDQRLQTCSQCGAIHPAAYSFFAPEHEKSW